MNDTIQGIIKQFVDATASVLGTMANTPVTPKAPYVKKDSVAQGDITGVIGFSNPKGKSKGTMSITFTKQAALGIIGGMLFEELTEITPEVEDAVGELTNMISGQARKGLVELGLVFEGAIPSVVTGQGHTIRHVSTNAILAIPFDTPHGPIMVEVCFS
ncbi:MAG: putative chemotaxis protein CheX [Desulfomicrobiaceae bacterium]|nr:putative chemotaxis protein CheX [Desulfomicrobiaceae bacterium]MDI3492164.1 chemotaxis protein CheX [Desulfomicrobiaceae bacterium]MDK2872509.1 chemotaxis protein CheX [Desulfomicrobiaceae bacterium]HCF05865.1 chemotaxis protein CheX [Desulfomicrobiaceae bacterium]